MKLREGMKYNGKYYDEISELSLPSVLSQN
jgi:hypothetical protein